MQIKKYQNVSGRLPKPIIASDMTSHITEMPLRQQKAEVGQQTLNTNRMRSTDAKEREVGRKAEVQRRKYKRQRIANTNNKLAETIVNNAIEQEVAQQVERNNPYGFYRRSFDPSSPIYQGSITSLSDAQWEDRNGIFANIGDTLGITNARNDQNRSQLARSLDRALWNLDSRNPSGGLEGIATNPAIMTMGTVGSTPTQILSFLGAGTLFNNLTTPFTGKTIGQYIGDSLPIITNTQGDLAATTFGGITYGTAAPYRARVAFYNNKNPYGYGNSLGEDKNIKEIHNLPSEVSRGIVEFLTPFSAWKPKNDPYWKKVLQQDKYKDKTIANIPIGADAEFRDMIFRQVLKLPQNKNGTIFVRNPDGTYGIDMAKRNEVVKQYGGSDYDGTIIEITDSPRDYHYDNFSDYDFLTVDNIAGVGARAKGTYKVDPNTSEATITMSDMWDVQPFSDDRNPLPWLKSNKAKQFEVIKFLGGKPTTQVFTVKNPNILGGTVTKSPKIHRYY